MSQQGCSRNSDGRLKDHQSGGSMDISLRLTNAKYALSEFADGFVKLSLNCGNCRAKAAEVMLNVNIHVDISNNRAENDIFKADPRKSAILKNNSSSEKTELDAKVPEEDFNFENEEKLEEILSNENVSVGQKPLYDQDVSNIETAYKSLNLEDHCQDKTAYEHGENVSCPNDSNDNQQEQEAMKEELANKDVDTPSETPADNLESDKLVNINTENASNHLHQETAPEMSSNGDEDDDDDCANYQFNFTTEDLAAIHFAKCWSTVKGLQLQYPEALVPSYHTLAGVRKERCKKIIRRMIQVYIQSQEDFQKK